MPVNTSSHPSAKGKLFLIPTPIGDTGPLPAAVTGIINLVDEFIVEQERTARRFLRDAGYHGPLGNLVLHTLNEHTPPADAVVFLAAAADGKHIGLLSEAGLPCIADPGAIVVAEAHRQGITVVPVAGPSSLFMALMASGLNGQQFTFHGYLPRGRQERKEAVRRLQHAAVTTGYAQLFIETPYRNDSLLDDVLATCAPSTLLCIAAGIGTEGESIRTRPVAAWITGRPRIGKVPAVFILGA